MIAGIYYLKTKLAAILLLIFSVQIISAQNEFITTWKPGNIQSPVLTSTPFASSATQAWAPFRGTNFTIYWEEVGYPSHHMTITNVSSASMVLLDFGTALNPTATNATYRVKVSNGNGNFHRILFRDYAQPSNLHVLMGDTSKILEVNQWGSTAWSSMGSAFQSCRNLNVLATDSPDLSNVSDLSYMFEGCDTLIGNPSFNNWDTSSVTSLLGTFSGCILFNQPVGNWNTSNVQTMSVTFLMAQNFNQPIGNWNTSQVVSMDGMFNSARTFNQPIGNWNVSNVQEMEFMFANAWAFNQPIGNWNTSQVTEMNGLFLQAKAFNQPLGNWNTSNVYTMNSMFFGATVFNQPIGSWNTSSLILAGAMFFNAPAFNQNLSSWNTSQIKNMESMFSGASSFNQQLGNWDLSSLLFAQNMFYNSGLSCQNYDTTLYGWSQNPSTAGNINLTSASPMIYTNAAAVAARSYLINNKGWIITGDTYNSECESLLGTSETSVKQEIYFYPNPVKEIIYIKNISGAATYSIHDQSGRIVKKDLILNSQINVSPLVNGNYILQVPAKDKIHTFKFIKE